MSGKRGGRKGRGGGAGGVPQVEGQMTKLTIGETPKPPGSAVSLYPKRPPRSKPAPGKPVRLLTNLFRMYIKQDKPIYQNGIHIDIEENSDQPKGGAGDTEKVPRKLGNELRRNVITKAVEKWVKEKKPSDCDNKLEYKYVLDSNASVLYTLFNMFKDNSESKLEFRITLQLDTIVGNKLAKVEKLFLVRITKLEQPTLNINVLFQFCSGIGSSDITLVQQPMRALNVILRGKISTVPTNVLTAVNVFPFKPENQFSVGSGVIINKGYSISVRPTEGGVALNVANTVGAFYEEVDLVDMLRHRFRVQRLQDPLKPNIIDQLKKELKNKQVEARHINYGTQQRPHYRKYRIESIGEDSLSKFMLVNKETKDADEVTIADYFLKEYKWKLKYPKLPCIIDKGRKLPFEVCHLIDKQRVMRKMDPVETAEIIKKCAVPPQQHFAMLKRHVEDIHNQRQPLNDFGLEFEPKPIQVDGRELMPIALIGKTGKDISPRDGQYNCDYEGFFKPTSVNKWALTFLTDFETNRDKEQAADLGSNRFSDLYCKSASFKGIKIPKVARFDTIPADGDEKTLKNTLERYFKFLNRDKIDHAIIVLPKQCPDWVYRYIQYMEISAQEGRKSNESWTRTSCIKYQNYKQKILFDRSDGKMFLANLWLKHNTKLGGINYVLKPNPQCNFLQEGFIFISVDVCHPAPGDKLIQSVAACVGMWNLTNLNLSYCTRLRVQKKVRDNNSSTIENVGEIDVMVSEILEEYKKKNNKYPQKIVILRDGVSEGQYRMVLQEELGKVKGALKRIYGNAKLKEPPMSCIVVQKRHKVRFMRAEPFQGRKGPDFNIQPGTVVDSGIVHPTDFSFYLAPHKAIQGTSRPAHNYIILDEIGFSQDEAQSMIHALSYLSPRCNKSTSIPTPVNLADLAAERGKNIVISWNNDNTKKMSEEERLNKLNILLSNMGDSNYKNTLYYV